VDKAVAYNTHFPLVLCLRYILLTEVKQWFRL